MSAKEKCFWLELAAWGLMIAGLLALDLKLRYGWWGTILMIVLLTAAWGASLLGLGQWNAISPEEKKDLKKRYFWIGPERMIRRLPVCLPFSFFLLLLG